MSKVAIKGASTGTATFTIESPATNTDRTLVLPDNAGTVLTSASALAAANLSGRVPAANAPLGSVIQVVSATTSTQVSITTTTFTDSGLTATITPSSTNSKILVFVSQQTHFTRQLADARGAVKLVRSISGGSSTDINLYVGSQNRSAGGIRAGTDISLGRNELTAIVSMNYLDSPATTSAVTYKTQGRPQDTSNAQELLFQYDSSTSQIVLMEIAG
jgi:hypothetical protein